MKNLLLNIHILVLMFLLTSCVKDAQKKDPPANGSSTTTVNLLKALDITPASFNEDTSSLITLSYTDINSRKALSCSLLSMTGITPGACSCDAAGVCKVSVTGALNFNGAANFRYNVSIGGEVSSTGTANFTIIPVDDPPVTSNISPPSFKYNTQSIITLPYVDVDGDKATSCTIAAPTNITVTTACACSAGICTVGVTGLANYIGSASFTFSVVANAVVSNSSTASLTITGNPPVANNITPAQFAKNTQSIMTLSYTDADGDLATTCSVSNLVNSFISQPCSCTAGGVCTVGVTGNFNFIGNGSFNYTVTTAGQVSNTATSTYTITDTVPVAANITPPAFNEDIQSIITLSYTDPLNRKATACSISAASNVSVTTACTCDVGGICQVGITGVLNYNGAASFGYTVTAGGLVSNTATASLTINPVDDPPTVANVLIPDIIYEDTQSGFLTLNYTDVDGDRAGVNDCTISGATNLTITSPCTCDVILGNCSLKVTGNLHYFGAASFDYKVKTTTLFSNVATASVTITHKDHPPVSSNITPPAFNEDTQSIITLSYTDIDSDKASTCTLSSLGNVTVTRACACDAAGVCTVGVTGTLDYNGAASFYYTVTANGAVSNSSTATFTIIPVDDPPVAANISPPSFNQNTQSIITLSYIDVDGDKATNCSLPTLTNVTVTSACACDAAGVCKVGVTGTSNYSGPASFTYNVTTVGVLSNNATASLTINFVNTPPTISAIAATFGNQNQNYVVNFTINDIDGPLACSTAVTTTSSSNTTLIPVANIVFGGTYPNCTATITPTLNNFGASSLTFKVTDGLGASTSTSFTHTVRQSISKTWLLGDVGDINTYSYSSANIQSVLPGIIQLTPFVVDQTDNDNTANGFTALPATLVWDNPNLRVNQNHAISPWPLASGVYSTTYTSRVMDAKKTSNWSSIAWKSSLAFGKELPLTNEAVSDYYATAASFATSLVGLWHFNEITGSTTFKNSKTSISDAFLVNSPAASVGIGGKFTNALQFNGGSVIKSSTSAAITPGAFSVSMWINKTSNPTENVFCFWTTNDAISATDCPLKISTVVRLTITTSNYTGTTVINDGFWHNIVVVSDSVSASTKVYIDGVLETFGSAPPNFSTAGSIVYLGSNVGTSGSYTGKMDETAIWNRVLSAGEALELFRRGANRLKMYYRTCPDATCSTNPAFSSQLSELDNVTSGEANPGAPSFTIAPTAQRYFQYKTVFETDVVPTTSAPNLMNVVVGPVHYYYTTSEEAFVTQEGLSFKALSNFTESLGTQACSGSGGGVHYQLSKDKINWTYYNGSAWVVGTNFATASTVAQLISGLPTYASASNTVSDIVYIRAILKSDAIGSAPCEVNQLKLDGFE